MGAGLIMVMARTTFHSLLQSNPNFSCHDLLFQINNMIFQNTKRGIFMSMLLMQVDLSKNRVYYAGAGHEHILIYHTKSKSCEKIPTGGLILGVKKNQEYGPQEIHLSPGDKLVLYTDGATEAMNAQHQEFGLDRMVGLVEKFHDLASKEMCHAILGELQKFMEGQKQHDDITLVALERTVEK
jgi:serine phosphatase RsbU (regulator of sigma subunit)